MLDQAFVALQKFNWGTSLNEVAGIEDAVVTAHTDADLRKDLEQRLIAVLSTDVSADAKGYVCRKLAIVGSPAAVPALGGLLTQEDNAHLARQALERIPGPEAAAALKDALPRLSGKLKIGVIGSLGARREAGAIGTLAGLLGDSDRAVARAATLALAAIGGAEAAQVLTGALRASTGDKLPLIIDALLSCAESLLANHKRTEAAAIYKSFCGDEHPRLVRLAANRGLLACNSQQT
ncbi:MAG TPA: HEAT repeat domain-containing protein [Pirellulales bacterium]|nr:HEAT repeat domain-containing protein [Pirellulales bacterium]